ncbi:MAG: sulfite exporter TauE/SafE family protein [Gammaproteobacteria bacterium]|nr:sulfite exporter TauE/SafE family protein [Rhodocyclaceae bacterium]MBU3908199.1 sulfite exporter TauE/SafE family protein [Gammaproteobacteria bacterium]MBU3988373.1 sulfite exporter TauE/SafE family protein [Gammaproteobacteria bacterium]MBU4005976.1 sulfite exporter TauE/SafE family protein [Gammaproteobacteria bacterium]MBU4020018.1 sulfite exporter TauE/SafE family protein [Gammaproteobacteria bacterium]
MLEELATGQVTLATVWLLGVSMGLTACTVTCLPFMGTWALGRASGQREAFLHTGVFLAGRVTTYTVLAALAGAVGFGLAQALGGTWGNAVIGGASILAGLWLLAKPSLKSCNAAVPPAPTFQTVRFQRKADTLPPLFLGAALSLTPCTPLASLLALAANAGSAIEGASFGLAFGLGAAMTPILVLVPLAGRLGRELRAGRAWLSRWLLWSAAAVLIVLGIRRVLLAF